MFDNRSVVDVYGYDIDLSIPVSFYCKLVYDIANNNNEQFKLNDLFQEEFLKTLNIRLDAESTIDDLASKITQSFNQRILDKLNFDVTDIYLIYKNGKILFVNGEKSGIKEVKSNLTEFIKAQKIFDKFSTYIKSDKLQNSVKNLTSIGFDELFRAIVSLEKPRKVWVPYLPYDFLEPAVLTDDIIDEEDIQINVKRLLKDFSLTITEGQSVNTTSVKLGDGVQQEIGIHYNNLLFPTVNVDLGAYIKSENYIDYCWLMFKEVFKKSINRAGEYESDLTNKFKASSKDTTLNNHLSNLEKNLYLPINVKEEIGDLLEFFDEVSLIDKLDHLNDLEFYVSTERGKTALGVYATKKIGDSYNLLHWVKGHQTEQANNYFRDTKNPLKKADNLKLALKPEIAFYFLSNYFEDFLEEAIKQVTNDYIKNFELYSSGTLLGEMDFLIKTPTRLCFIEAKTKLTDEYIEAFILKCNKIIKGIAPIQRIFEIDFYLISAFSDGTVLRKKYFIDRVGDRADYNLERAGLKTIPYYFQVPIPQHVDTNLTCIAEPEFNKLVEIIKEICAR